MLQKFERYPLTFGPTPIEKLPRLSTHLGGRVEIYAKREDCNSGLAFGGNKLRKLEYIVPDAHRLQRRYPGHDRRRAVQPHAPGRRGGRQARHEVPAGAGELGAVRGRRLRPRRQHPDEPRHGRRDRAGRRGLRHRHPRKLGARHRGRQGQGRQALRHPRRRLGAQIRRPGLRRLRRGGARAGSRARLQVRLHHRLHRDRLDACRHAGRLRQGWPRTPRDRHRCLGHARADRRPGARHRTQHGTTGGAWPGHHGRRSRAHRRTTPILPTASRPRRPTTPSASPRAPKA